MKPLTTEWVTKAEGDFATATRESRARKAPNPDAVCFHAQQCIEKYLKALLQETGNEFPRTHNLLHLLDLLGSADPSLDEIRADLSVLNVYAVAVRYPGDSADRDDSKSAMTLCRKIRKRLRAALNLR